MELHKLQAQIKKEFKEYNCQENLIRLYYWIFKEYKNHATLLVPKAKKTLEMMVIEYPEYQYHLEILLKYINENDSLECYFNLGIVLSNESDTQNDIIPLLHYTDTKE